MSNTDTEKPGCVNCGEQFFHRMDCPFHDKKGFTPVLDSERKDFGSMAQATAESLAPKCAGLEGCHDLEGVMYDLFVHDAACLKGSPTDAPVHKASEPQPPSAAEPWRIERQRKQDSSAVGPPAISELGEFWRHWFHCVGEHAIIEVVHATTDLVLAEREIAVRDALAPIRAALAKCEAGALHPDGRISFRKSDWDAVVAAVKGEK